MKVHNPFRVAFVATLGVGLGLLFIGSLSTLSTILLYIGTALFLSLGLEPLVAWLERRKLPRWAAVLITILGVLAIFAGIVLLVLPIIIEQIGQLVTQLEKVFQNPESTFEEAIQWVKDTFPLQPQFVDDTVSNAQDWILNLDWAAVGGGVLQAGLAVVLGLGGAFIVLILTI